ncbi:MAG: ribosome biogenesis GTPase Der [Prevotella sp.]|nr:ribosome biogenesis GTPase Der [Bacteroides sp.]MCM1367085.1 ribosome biogenesis GTPase Der [Prevotella sp.]MCM1437558.1 ribosome biogenesis GTPase Der [Prevotella sp.]
MSRLVAIVGRPNVGKSTLFNRLTQTRRAIVDDTAGTTRDRQYGTVDWCGQEFSIVDTGGWVVNSEDIFEGEINKQVEIAIEEADVILFVVDASNGITDLDDHVAAILRRSKKPVILVANKEDIGDARYNVPEFYKLGLGTPIEVSSANGSGTGELLDEIVADMPEPTEDDKPEDNIAKIAIVGRPNAGKSSLINAFIGEERHIVTDIAGTTRDSIYHRYNKFGFDFYLVDTAGIRKKQKVNEDIEYYSVIRSIRAIEASDVCILMIDATRGIESQDANIFGLIQRNRKGLVVCVNKWDIVEDRSLEAQKRFEDAIRKKLAPFVDFPILFTSALTKQRIHKVLETATHVYENRKRQIPTSQLNSYMLEVVAETPPPSNKGKFVKIKYVTMLKDAVIPTFVFFCNLPQWVKEPYRRFLENKIRAKWDFHGTPIAIFMRDKS